MENIIWCRFRGFSHLPVPRLLPSSLLLSSTHPLRIYCGAVSPLDGVLSLFFRLAITLSPILLLVVNELQCNSLFSIIKLFMFTQLSSI